MSLPLIGITTYGVNDNKDYPLPVAYIKAIRSAGGIPLMIPPGEIHLEKIIFLIDGLILSGGGDLDSSLYNGDTNKNIYMVDQERDQSELKIARLFLESNKPLFCICRGIQVLNLIYGGTLFEHLPDHFGEKVLHRLPPRVPVCHEVIIEPDSKLSKILKTTKVNPASWHHQSIKDLGDGLKIVARANDNVIEAVEVTEHPWLIGVQWHPELTFEEDQTQLNLFKDFVETCKK